MAHGEALDVKLVNHSLMPWNPRRRVSAPGEGRIDHAALRHSSRIVAPVERHVFLPVSNFVAEERITPPDASLYLLAVGIKQQFVVIESMTLLRRVWSIDPVSVKLVRPNLWQIAVPHHVRLFG